MLRTFRFLKQSRARWGIGVLIWLVGLSSVPRFPFFYSAHAASATGQIHQRVITSLKLVSISALDFGSASPGASETSVDPDSLQGRGATFLVSGEPNMSFQISLPKDGEVSLRLENSTGPSDQIAVKGFRSDPGLQGVLGADGSTVISIGATRAALRVDQALGTYSGTFTVTAVY